MTTTDRPRPQRVQGVRKPESTNYLTLHTRIYAARGKAANYDCVDCGKQAADWSQIKGCDGTDTSHYDPRCRSCHRLYDGGPRGETNGQAVLTETEVREIRRLAIEGLSWQKIADLFGISQRHAGRIIRRERWAWLT